MFRVDEFDLFSAGQSLESPAQSAVSESDRAAPASADANAPSHFAQYVLHPPLPAVTSSDQLSAIPLLLNPDILQSSKIPVITPQLTQVSNIISY